MLTLLATVVLSTQSAPTQLQTGTVITKSGTIKPQTFTAPSIDNSGKTAAVTIRGNNVVFDFAGSTILGRRLGLSPSGRRGTGLRIEGMNVTVKNLNVHAYKIGLIADNAPGLKIINCDFSYNWKQKLGSTLDREDSGDWMSYHQNEKDEWLQYGAGIYLRDCDNFEVKGTTITNGQCGLMITNCDNGLVWNNNFSFLSAIGLGMYRSSNNRVMHNNIDWCLRGYSHGKWNRGQDSAGILIYEQSNKNVFAYNSVTHGGDGFFLWAGQSTMDNGKGGCNDNLLYGNDWSHAPTNGIEATFSRNTFINNLIMECWHGVWGGYSYNTKMIGNVFAYNAESIALEHGQDNEVRNNLFFRDTTVMKIWQNKSQDPNWGYPKNRDTKSRDYLVQGNTFMQIPDTAIDVRDTLRFIIGPNTWESVKNVLTARGDVTGLKTSAIKVHGIRSGETVTHPARKIDAPVTLSTLGGTDDTMPATMQPSGNVVMGYNPAEYGTRFRTNWNPLKNKPGTVVRLGKAPIGPLVKAAFVDAPKPLVGGKDPFLTGIRGRRYMLVDEWGPYDFKRPILWPRGEIVKNSQVFEILGPVGMAKIVAMRGLHVLETSTDGVTWKPDNSLKNGTPVKMPVPSYVKLGFDDVKGQDLFVKLAYTGAEVTNDRGEVTPKGTPYFFSWSKYFLPIEWTVRFWSYDPKTQDPREDYNVFNEARKGEPLAVLKTNELNFAWSGAPAPGVPSDHFTTIAEGTFEVAAGKYILRYTTDDGYRLYIDGTQVKEDWSWHAPKTEEIIVNFQAGKHTLKMDHFELDGFSTLKLEVIPVR